MRKRLSLASFTELQDFYTKTEIEQIRNLLKAQKRMIKLMIYFFSKHQNQNVCIVSHGNIIKATFLSILNLKLSQFQRFTIFESSLSIIKGNSIKDAKIISLNDTAHLEKN